MNPNTTLKDPRPSPNTEDATREFRAAVGRAKIEQTAAEAEKRTNDQDTGIAVVATLLVLAMIGAFVWLVKYAPDNSKPPQMSPTARLSPT
jgi:flagellar biogenesis protein FliO